MRMPKNYIETPEVEALDEEARKVQDDSELSYEECDKQIDEINIKLAALGCKPGQFCMHRADVDKAFGNKRS